MFHNYKIRPMLLREKLKIFQSDDYLYEIKFDGFRALIFVSKDELVILSRKGTNITKYYPELKGIQDLVGKDKVIFDGEIIATLNGVPNFSLLQKRSRVKKVSDNILRDIPVSFVAFDVLYVNKDLTSLTLEERKKVLDKYKDTNFFVKSKCYHDGKKLFAMVKKFHLEGVVAKKKDSLYFFGERTLDWIKIKNIKVDNFLVHGYIKMMNTYSLLLGEYVNNKLVYVGRVGVNKGSEIVKKLKLLKPTHNQFINCSLDAIYVKPLYTVRVKYLKRTKANLLRHASVDK